MPDSVGAHQPTGAAYPFGHGASRHEKLCGTVKGMQAKSRHVTAVSSASAHVGANVLLVHRIVMRIQRDHVCAELCSVSIAFFLLFENY